MFHIGVITDCFKLPLVQAIDCAAKLGMKGIQLYATEGELSPEQMTPAKIKEIKDMIQSKGLVVSGLCGDFGGHGFMEAEDNQRRVEKSKRIVDLALSMGTNIITTHIGVISADKQNETRKIMLDACSKMSEYAQNMGAIFAVETGPESAVFLKDFLDEIPTKGIGVNLDPANLVMVAGDDPIQAVYTLKNYIVHTHAKDGVMLSKTEAEKIYGNFAVENRQHFYLETPLGQGGVQFDGYLKALQDIGYNGFLTIEREVGENPIEDIALAVEFLKEKMKNVKK